MASDGRSSAPRPASASQKTRLKAVVDLVLATLSEQVEDLTSKLGRVVLSSHLLNLMSDTRIDKTRRRTPTPKASGHHIPTRRTRHQPGRVQLR